MTPVGNNMKYTNYQMVCNQPTAIVPVTSAIVLPSEVSTTLLIVPPSEVTVIVVSRQRSSRLPKEAR